MNTHQLPELPLERFIELYEALNTDRGWWGDPSSLRFAAMTALSCPGEPETIARDIRALSDGIKQEAGWFGELSSPLRFIVSAMLLLHGDSPETFLAESKRVKELFRQLKLRPGGIYETMATLVLRQRSGGKPVELSTVERFRDIYEEMKRYHWWLTGPDDFPACAILVGEPDSPERIGAGVERIYQALDRVGFAKGDPLQTAANILYLAHIDADVIADRFRALADGFRERKVSIWQSDYDELAILSFLDHATSMVIDRVLENRARMAQLKPDPGRLLTFNLGAGIAFIELVKVDRALKTITDAKALMDMQAIIAAQQAAAAAAASSAAVAASTSSS
jgi:hypothetical protein